MGLSSQLAVSAIARPGVCTSSTRPASPYQGQVIYQTDTNTTLVWNGSGWVLLSTGTANPVGLELVKSVTVGTGVSTVDVTSCFSSAYDSYRVVVSNMTLGGSGYSTLFLCQMLSGSTPNTGSNYAYGFIKIDQGTGASSTDYGSASGSLLLSRGTNGVFNTSFDVQNPYAAQYTIFPGLSYTNGYNGYGGAGGGCHGVATSYDGIRFFPSTSTMTGGTINVYGYRRS